MDEVYQMQQEAARRVNRMQEHSRRVVETYRERAAQPTPAPRLYHRPAPHPSCASPSQSMTAVPSSGTFGSLDGEQILLLGLAVLLLRSGCRIELLAALLYIAL